MSENANLTAGWVILAEQNYAIRYQPGAYHVDFWAYGACEGWARGEDSDKPGTWELFDGREHYPLDEFEKAEWEIHAGVKWDGCINWQTNEACMVHGCGPRHAEEVAAIMGTFYTVAKRYFDLLGAAVMQLPDGAFECVRQSA